MDVKNYISEEDLERFLRSKADENVSINELITDCKAFIEKHGFKAFGDRAKNTSYNGATDACSSSKT